MLKKATATALFLMLGGCQRSDVKVLIGATVITASGAAPLAGSVIVVAGNTIRAVGLQKDVPVQQDSERTDLSGKWIVPAGTGTIAPGEPASLLILDHAPPATPVRRMSDGQWR